MPLQFKNIAVGNLQDDVSGNNYAANKAVYILNLNNTLAQIFSDEAGVTPIVQDGVNNVTNSKGVFGFWVEAGDYFVQVGANKYRVSITGADYFNNRVDETVNLIVDSVAGRGAYYPVGSFEAGFTYTDINQVGTFGGTDYYVYTGGLTNLPHTVTAGTNPTLSGDYAQVFYGEANSVQVSGGGTVQDFINNQDSVYFDDQRKFKFISGVIRNSGAGWSFIQDAGHEPLNFDVNSVSVRDGVKLDIDYTVTGSKVTSAWVSPDETLQTYSLVAGASVGTSTITVQASLPLQFYGVGNVIAGAHKAHENSITAVIANDRIEITHPIIGGDNGSRGPVRSITKRFNSGLTGGDPVSDPRTSTSTHIYATDKLQITATTTGSGYTTTTNAAGSVTASFTGGSLVITHPASSGVPTLSNWLGSEAYVPQIRDYTDTQVRINFADQTGTLVLAEAAGMNVSITKGDVIIDPSNLSYNFNASNAPINWDDLISAGGNIWIGVMIEV